MKKLYFLIAALFYAGSSFAQQWFSTYAVNGRDVNALWVLQQSEIVFAGGHQSNDSIEDVGLSHNSGLTWSAFRDTVSSWLTSVAFSDSLNGYAAGYNGKLMGTSDGGNSWTYYSSPINRHFNKVIYVTPRLLFAAGGWPSNDSVQTILKSTNGGNSWTTVYDQPGPWLKSICFIDTLNGFAVGNTGTILRTTDGGNSWNLQTPPIVRNFNAIVFSTGGTGFIVGGDTNGGELRTILQTTNGGTNWNVIKDEAGGELNDIAFTGSSLGYAVGDSASVFKTINSGQTWLAQSVDTSSASEIFNAVRVYDSSYAVVGGTNGAIYVYANIVVPKAYTLASSNIDSTDATLFGTVNTLGSAGIYWFYYTTDPQFVSYGRTNQFDLNTSTLSIQSAVLNALTPNTTYYYCITAATIAGSSNGDTLQFFTGVPAFIYSTEPATNINSNSAQLNGSVGKFTGSTSLFFQYGLTPSMGSQVTGSPAAITDTLQHAITAVLSSLQPNSIYYFRLKAVNGASSYYGDTYLFYTGTLPGTVVAGPAVNVTDTSAQLTGTADGFVSPVNLVFEYSASDPSFSSPISVNPVYITDSLQHNLAATLSGLTPNTFYWCRIKVISNYATFYSDTVSFFAGSNFNLTVLAPHNLSPATATFYGSANVGGQPSNIFFQYGINQAFDQQVPASPAQLSGTSPTVFSGAVTGLQPGQQYYFRVKLVDTFGTHYSASKSFFAVQNEIPNWNFENWQAVEQLFPRPWWIFGNAGQAPSYNGTTALSLYGTAAAPGGLAFSGIDLNGVVFGGSPFTARPDSFIFFADYDITPGDTAFAFLFFKKNGAVFSMSQFPVTGSTSGSFERIVFPLAYQTGSVPDTVMAGFASTNFFGGEQSAQSWLKVDDISFSGTTQNVPDADFEQWDSSSYEIPADWSLSTREIPINANFTSPISQTTDAFWGSYAIHLQNAEHGPINGLPVSAYITTAFNTHYAPSFPVTKRYNTFDGYFKFAPQNNDTAFIEALMFSHGNMIGSGSLYIDSAVSTYQPFFIPLMYNDSVSVPDSSAIRIAASSDAPQGPSALTVDDLGFDGFYDNNVYTEVAVPGIEHAVASLNLYPNPNKGTLHVDYTSPLTEAIVLRIYDLNGNVLYSEKSNSVAGGKTSFTLNLSSLSSSVYFIHLSSDAVSITSRFVLVR